MKVKRMRGFDVWELILSRKKVISNKVAEDMIYLSKKLRKERGFR